MMVHRPKFGKKAYLLGIISVILLILVVVFVILGRQNPDPTIEPTSHPTLQYTLHPTLQPSDAPSSESYEALRSKLEPYFLNSGNNHFPDTELQEEVLDWLLKNDALSQGAISNREILERFIMNIFYYTSESDKDYRTPKHVCEWNGFIHCNDEKFITYISISEYCGIENIETHTFFSS